MKLTPLSAVVALQLAAVAVVSAQQEDAPVPRAVVIPEDEVIPDDDGTIPAEDPGAPPKAIPIEEEGPPPDEEAPDEPWEDPEERRARHQEEERQREAEEKAREKAEREEQERLRKEREAEREEAKTVRAVPNGAVPPPVPGNREAKPDKPDKPKIPILQQTDPNAKPLSLRVPAPRGLIVDRNGQPLAQNRMASYIGLQLPIREGLTDAQVLDFARGPLAFCRAQLSLPWDVSDADIVQHYKKRRWVPLLSPVLLPDDQAAKVKDALPKGVALTPFFVRTYPEHSMAGHLLGQMQKNEQGFFNSSKIDLQSEEPMWPATNGRSGLERKFDKELTGEPGLYNALFDAKGEKLAEEWVERPRAGHTVVTTIDTGMQKIAERNLKERGVRGAFVIMDVKTGDIVAMASTPVFDPNDWVYGVGDDLFKKLVDDPEKPLFCRAIQGRYPPASTFKIITALAALETNELGPNSEFNCPPVMYFNGRPIKNHSRKHEGSMDVERAIMRSCNTWFFQAAKVCGPGELSAMALKFGYGQKTGLCLDFMETAGWMPTPESYAKKGGSMTGGILAITSIGQGQVEASPLQVAQMMAGVARGDAVPRPRLVKLIQDVDGRVVQHFPPSVRGPLGLEQENLLAVQRGMRQVVSGGGGTGTRAENHYVPIVGKTGTGQWHPEIRQNVAWFAGYIPYKNPEYAYACLYEGDPGESEISGGRKVAPIVGDVFNEIYKARKKKGELKEEDTEDDSERVTTPRPRRQAPPAEEVRPAQPAVAEAPPQKRGGLRWLFRRRTPQNNPPPPPSSGGRPLR